MTKKDFELIAAAVSRAEWDAAHFARDTDSYASRMELRRDGSVIVREYHCIRVRV